MAGGQRYEDNEKSMNNWIIAISLWKYLPILRLENQVIVLKVTLGLQQYSTHSVSVALRHVWITKETQKKFKVHYKNKYKM